MTTCGRASGWDEGDLVKIQTGCKIQVTRHDGCIVAFVIQGAGDRAWRTMLVEKCQSIVDNKFMETASDIGQTARKLNIDVLEVTIHDQGGAADFAAFVEA